MIDDRLKNGAAEFKGEHIHFGSDRFPNWESVVEYLKSKIDLDGVTADFDKKMSELAPDLFLGDGPDYEIRSKMVDEKNYNLSKLIYTI